MLGKGAQVDFSVVDKIFKDISMLIKHIEGVNASTKLVIIGLDNGVSPVRCQAIMWTNNDIFYWIIGIKLK